MVKPERVDTFVYIVLAVMPWVYVQLSTDIVVDKMLQDRITIVKEYMQIRKSSSVTATKVYKNERHSIDVTNINMIINK